MTYNNEWDIWQPFNWLGVDLLPGMSLLITPEAIEYIEDNLYGGFSDRQQRFSSWRYRNSAIVTQYKTDDSRLIVAPWQPKYQYGLPCNIVSRMRTFYLNNLDWKAE